MSMRAMKAGEPCFCGSTKVWERCCGHQLKNKEAQVLFASRNKAPSVRFFLGNMITDDAYTDEEGNVLIFNNCAQAMACNERLGLTTGLQVIGMSPAMWEKFQREVPKFIVVPDAVA